MSNPERADEPRRDDPSELLQDAFPKWLSLVLAFPLIGVLSWAAFSLGAEESAAEEPALPELPEPQPAREVPMIPSGTGYGWTWLNPLPRAMPTWYGADAANGGHPVVFVGHEGAAVRSDDNALYVWPTGVRTSLRGVAWIGANEALAAGDEGTLVRLAPGGPRVLESGTAEDLHDVVALGPDEALVVGNRGTVLRVSGETVSALEAPKVDLLAAFARGDDVFIVGEEGTVLRLRDGIFHSEKSGTRQTLRAVGGCPSGLVYAAGDQGTLMYRRRSGEWQHVRVNGNMAFTALSCDHGRVAAARVDGELLLVSGARTVRLPSGFDRAWYAVVGGPRGPSWLVGAGGRIATIENDHVRTRTAGPSVPIRALGSMGGALVAVGEWGRILREQERGFVQVDSPTEAGLASLIQLDEGRLLAVGDFGAMVDIRFDGAELVEVPTQRSLRDGVAHDGELLVVGAQGQLLRGRLGMLESVAVSGAGDLWSVVGTPRDAIAVGEGGVVLRFIGGRIERLRCAGEPTLRAVVRSGERAWAVGDEGSILRIEGHTCVEEHRGGPTLHAIGFGPDGRLLAAGDEGVVLVRADGGVWEPEEVDVGRASVRAIWRSDRYVHLAGTDGVLVRHIRIDG